MAHLRDYYAVLQVSPQAGGAIIKAAYYTQLKTSKKHPDLGGSHEEAVLLNEAYEVLSDPLKRKEYDQKFFKGKHLKDYSPTMNPFQPDIEKRRAVRVPLQKPLRFRKQNIPQWVEAQLRDISLLGACFRSLTEFKKGELIDLDVSKEPALKTKAQVRWVRQIPQRFGKPLYEGGVEFEKLDPIVLEQFLKQSSY